MTTVRDGTGTARGPQLPSIDDFLAERREARARRAREVSERRIAYRERIAEVERDHCARAEALFSDPRLGIDERDALLLHHRQAMNAEIARIKADRRRELGPHRPWETGPIRWLGEHERRAADRADYRRILEAAYDDGGRVDPVLLRVPGARRYRESGDSVYTLEGRELLRALHDTGEIVVRANDDAALEAAIVKAQHEFGPPLTFVSDDPLFIARCERIATAYGFAYERSTASAERADASDARAATDSAARAATATPGGDSPDPAEPPSPMIDPKDPALADLRAAIEEQDGITLFMSLRPEAKVALSGRLLNAVPHPSADGYRIAALETVNGATLIALPDAALPGIELGTTLTVRGRGAMWDVEAAQPERDAERETVGVGAPTLSRDTARGR